MTTPFTMDQLRTAGPTIPIKQANQVVGVSDDWSYELLKRGQYPCAAIRVSGRWRVPTEGLLALLECGTTPEASEA